MWWEAFVNLVGRPGPIVTTGLVITAALLVVAVAGVVHDRIRGSRSGLRHAGDDTMARYHRDVRDSNSQGL